MKQPYRMNTSQGFAKMIRFLVVLLLLSACQPLVQPVSPAQENNPLLTANKEEPTATETVILLPTPEIQATQQAVEPISDDPSYHLDLTGNNPMSPVEALLLRSLKLEISIPMPNHPQQVALYRRQPETLTETGSVTLFQKMGIDGTVSGRTAEAGNAIYTASSQGYIMNINSDTPPFFVLGRGNPSIEPGNQPFEERKRLADTFLQAHQLPAFPYRIEPVYGPYGQNQAVAVAQIIEDMPLYQGRSPWVWLAFDGQGQLVNLVFQELQLVQDGQVVLRPVREVWAELQAHTFTGGSTLRILSTQEWKGDPTTQSASINQVELLYFAANTHGMWVGGNPADSPIRVVRPVWRFTGQLTDGTPVEILAEAAASAQGEASQPTPVETKIAQADAQLPTGMIKANSGEDIVNVRSGPGAIYDRIGALTNGQTVFITGRSPQWEWWRIQTDEMEGWVYSAFLTVNSAAGIPCVEQKAGDCETSGLSPEHDQATASIQTFRNQNDLLITYGGETANPNTDLRDSLVYMDDQGAEYLVDKETLRVVEWTPQPSAGSGETKTVEELRSLALTFAYHQSPRLAQNESSLSFTQMTKDWSHYAFRWEDQSITGHILPPFLQVVIRTDGEILQYMNTIDIWTK